MATSGTYNFSMDIDEVIQEATEMIGGEITLGEEPRSARRSINLLLQDWQNRGIQLWTIGTTAVTVTTSTTKKDTRIRGRQLALRVSSDAVDDKWRYGTIRFDGKPDGMRGG